MNERKGKPGVSREMRISDEGLARLEAHLQRGMKLAAVVKRQWVKRYGDRAIELFNRYGQGDGL